MPSAVLVIFRGLWPISEEPRAGDLTGNLAEVELRSRPLEEVDVNPVGGGRRPPLPGGNELRLPILILFRCQNEPASSPKSVGLVA